MDGDGAVFVVIRNFRFLFRIDLRIIFVLARSLLLHQLMNSLLFENLCRDHALLPLCLHTEIDIESLFRVIQYANFTAHFVD